MSLGGEMEETQKPALKLKRLQEMPVQGKRVLVRVDFNVPIKNGAVSDESRLRAALPTLKHLSQSNAKIILISHLGRPKGKPEEKYSLKPVAKALEKIIGMPVAFFPECVGPEAKKAALSLKEGEILLMENLRFHAGEEKNDSVFAQDLASLGEVFVEDAFGAIHRAHASTVGIPKILPSCVGFLVQRELEFLDRVIGNPARPFVAIIGGAKVSDKLGVLNKLLDRVDTLLIGGGMAYTFLAAQGVSIGKSLLEKEKIADAQAVIDKSYSKKVTCLLPADHLAVLEIKQGAQVSVTQGMAIPEQLIGADIGPHTIEIFLEEIEKAKTIFWNGPMGVFEIPEFSSGSRAIAEAMAKAGKNGAVTIVGGGDSLAVLSQSGLSEQMSHCSTGGGASLELLEGKNLPGLSAISS